ncbi:MAG: hemolysin III family protein [Frankiaceae bacterium]
MTSGPSLPSPPRLRGLLHGAAFPAVVVAGAVLVALARTDRARVACAVYATSAALLFGVSALYHRWRRGDRWRRILRRLDHANIFLIIAGSYTPFAVLLLHGRAAITVLAVVWAGALAGIVLRTAWPAAPRWVHVPVYLGLGWVAVFVTPQLHRGGGTAVLVLVAVGGGLYTAGALVYALRRPDPWPRWFGFHEVFHALTVAAFVVHYIAISIVAYVRA